ncbi:hypothetical protein NDU88_002390 [Pleurodeles waltl]|uniref:Uncharacterized protein n=1 Tax=Pleurodeles waltl TaxID=8319 RepID=A0AAV7WL40_PLEWA|nr:hypothetical protein NDU88_002390 [Pleurodeles waltl]
MRELHFAHHSDTFLDKLDLILQEIQDSRTAIEKRLGAITTNISFLKDDQCKLVDRVKMTLSTLSPGHGERSAQIAQLQQPVDQLQDPAEDKEERACKSNVRIVWLLEGMEGSNATQYVKDWLCRVVALTGGLPSKRLRGSTRSPLENLYL